MLKYPCRFMQKPKHTVVLMDSESWAMIFKATLSTCDINMMTLQIK